jgi:hypothetical protein
MNELDYEAHLLERKQRADFARAVAEEERERIIELLIETLDFPITSTQKGLINVLDKKALRKLISKGQKK